MSLTASDFEGYDPYLDSPAGYAESVTPDNSNNLPNVTRGIYVGATGDMVVDMFLGGTSVTFTGLAAGVVHPLRVKKIHATGTTASSIVALY